MNREHETLLFVTIIAIGFILSVLAFSWQQTTLNTDRDKFYETYAAIQNINDWLVPAPIVGVISGNVEGVKIVQTNLRTNETYEVYTNKYGEFIFDWALSKEGYEFGDIINVTIQNTNMLVTIDESGMVVNDTMIFYLEYYV